MFKNRRVEVRMVKDDPKVPDEPVVDIKPETIYHAGEVGKKLIAAYFGWKMADRVLEKLLR